MKKSTFRGAAAALLLLAMAASASAQTKDWKQSKRWEHNVYQGIGLSRKFIGEDKQTVALHVGYAVSYLIAPRWNIMPGVGLRVKAFGSDNNYAGSCASTYIDIPILLQYHFNKNTREGIVAECGPVLSFLAHSEKYSTGWEHVAYDKNEYRNFDLGLQPAVYYETGNWRFGVQSHIGLIDTKCKYRKPYDHEHGFGQYEDPRYDDPRLTHRYYAFDVVATINYHW